MSSMRHLVILFFALFISTIAASAKTERQELDKVLLDKDLWSKSLEDIKAIFDPESSEDDDDDVDLKISKKLREKMAKEGISIDDLKGGDSGPFEWLSEQKKGLRSPGGNLSFLGMDIGEVVIRAKGETVSDVTLFIYNRGDDDRMKKSDYAETMSTWRSALKEELKVRDDDRDQTGRIEIDGSMWKKDDSAWLLEGSVTRRENRVEFIRLRLASLSAASRSDGKLARRDSLGANVVKKDIDETAWGQTSSRKTTVTSMFRASPWSIKATRATAWSPPSNEWHATLAPMSTNTKWPASPILRATAEPPATTW